MCSSAIRLDIQRVSVAPRHTAIVTMAPFYVDAVVHYSRQADGVLYSIPV
jgi:hypothetical protein